MKECKQHQPIAIEWETAVEPVTGQYRWMKEGVVHDIHAPRLTKVKKLKCFTCGEIIELNWKGATRYMEAKVLANAT